MAGIVVELRRPSTDRILKQTKKLQLCKKDIIKKDYYKIKKKLKNVKCFSICAQTAFVTNSESSRGGTYGVCVEGGSGFMSYG